MHSIVFIKPFRGLIRVALEYLIDEDNLNPFQEWIARLKSHLGDPLKLR